MPIILKPIKDRQLKRIAKKIGRTDLMITSKEGKQLGEEVVEEIRRITARGLSPIRKEGRFPAYKRAKDKDGYPNNVKNKYPDKKKRPVNLRLSGDFMRNLRAKNVKKDRFSFAGFHIVGITIGWKSRKDQLKEEGHREGVNGQPKRPIIPTDDEEFSPKIKKIIVEFFEKRAQRWVRKS